jgi:mannose-6-phosphate isomerase-like protein (cupin superfamily)
MKQFKSAKRTPENSPANYPWDRDERFESSQRSGRLVPCFDGTQSAARFTGSSAPLISPTLKCWATFGRPLRGLLMLGSAALLLTATAVISAAQSPQRKPSEATRPVVVKSAQSLDDLKQQLKPGNKTEELIDSAGMELRVAIQHENNRTDAAAELHDASDDVYYVLEGAATLMLGGKLESPKEVEPGEWRSPRIIDGKAYEINKGDLVVVPRGTPHQRSTANKDFTMILIKIYENPLKPGAPKPSSQSQKP